MERMVTRNVNDIPESSRRSLEDLLGHHLEASQQVFIMVLNPAAVPDEAARKHAAVGIRQIIIEAERHAVAADVTEDEADAAIEEAMALIRRRPG